MKTNFEFMSENEAKQKVKPFCDKKLYSEDKSLKDMMKEQICPEWIVRSQPFLGRCVPFLPKNATSSGDIFEEDWVRSLAYRVGRRNLCNFVTVFTRDDSRLR